MTSFRETSLVPLSAVFRKQVRHQLRYPGEFLIVFIIPYFLAVLLLAMGGFVGGQDATANFAQRTGSDLPPFIYQIIGTGVWMVSWVIVETVGTSLREEQIKGTLEQNFIAPINRFVLLVGTALSQIVVTTLIFVGVIAASVLVLLPLDASRLVFAFLLLIIGLVPMFGIGFVVAAFVVRFKEPYALTQAINLIFGVLGGTTYTITLLPVWVQYVSKSLPLTLVILDMRLILQPTSSLATTGGSLLVLLVMGLVFPTLGYGFFKAYEKKAKVSGELSKY